MGGRSRKQQNQSWVCTEDWEGRTEQLMSRQATWPGHMWLRDAQRPGYEPSGPGLRNSALCSEEDASSDKEVALYMLREGASLSLKKDREGVRVSVRTLSALPVCLL